jgi:hypothetical protein
MRVDMKVFFMTREWRRGGRESGWRMGVFDRDLQTLAGRV